jgi:tetratricopeptide (TPR) repeat protein
VNGRKTVLASIAWRIAAAAVVAVIAGGHPVLAQPATGELAPHAAWDAASVEALKRYRAGEFDTALALLEPWLAADLDRSSRQEVEALVTRTLHARGEEHFRQARIAEAIADFDRQIALDPEIAAGHWQRGIAFYYAEEFDKGARQFELHQTVNPQDVENSAWHFLCVARGTNGSVDKARNGLLSVTDDPRAPMAEIQRLFAGAATPEDVQRAGEQGGDSGRFYADLYVGLYFEALGRDEESLRCIERAAENPVARDSYMGDVARVHVKLHKMAAGDR